MKTKLLLKIAVIVVITLFSFGANAQDASKNVKQKITNERGKPSLIVFNETSSYKSSDEQKALKEQLELNDNSSFSIIKTETDHLGIDHQKFQLYHQRIKVEFSTYTIHSKSGKLKSMSGDYYDVNNLSVKPTLSKEQAFTLALKNIGASNYLWESAEEANLMNYQKPVGELVILPIVDEDNKGKKTERFRLAYKFDIYATNPVSRGDIYIDAINGESLFYNATIKHLNEFSAISKKTLASKTVLVTALVGANADSRYSGTQSIETKLSGSTYILSDDTRGGGVQTFNMKKGTNYSAAVNFTDADNNWTKAEYQNLNKDDGALDAHWGAEMTYDYWKNVHGRNSFNNAGATIKSYVHYSSNYNNAYWNGSVMTYGDGSGTLTAGSGGFDILTSLDVAGHEIGHAVCSNTANLAYQNESGALNEALSDIWGACIEYYADPNKQRWLIGEDIERRSGHLALRSMSNPKTERQPDTYGGTNWVSPKGRPNSSNDYGGVHTNSGVLNHWFYILTEGKTGTNDKGDSYNVSGILIDKAAKITFRMENLYLSSNSTYADARIFGIRAAEELYGAGSAEVIASTNAFYAVGVGAAYSGSTDTIAPSNPTNLVASNITQTTTDLAWTASTDNIAVVGYDVFRGATKIGSSTNTTYSVTELTANTNYTFTVKAKDAAGNVSGASNSVPVTTLAIPVDTEVPSNPTNLVASNITQTTTDLNWTASTDNMAVTAYDVFNGLTLIGSSATNSYSVTGLTANTNYSFTVKAKDAAGNVSGVSNSVPVTTLAVSLIYCTSEGGGSSNHNIQNVTFGTINNSSSTNSTYDDFTANSTDVQPNSSYTITITPYTTSRKYKEGYAVFIDFNGDKDFDDAGETVFTSSPTNATFVSGLISIPSNATIGNTRMRVSMKYNGIPKACETFSGGQVEDYSVNITAVAGIISEKTITNSSNDSSYLTLYPNPVKEIVTITILDNKEGEYKIYNNVGYEVQNGRTSGGEINVNTLKNGIYILKFNNGENTFTKTFVKN